MIARGIVLETYAGIAAGDDLVAYATEELSEAKFAEMLESERVRAWIAETREGRCPVGYALIVSDEGGKMFASFELKRLYLFYRFQGHKLGRGLLEKVLAFARCENTEKIWLEVYETNQHAIEFYKHCGFLQRGRNLFRTGNHSYRVLTFELAF